MLLNNLETLIEQFNDVTNESAKNHPPPIPLFTIEFQSICHRDLSQ